MGALVCHGHSCPLSRLPGCDHAHFLCFRHPFSAEEDQLHHQFKKTSSRTSLTAQTNLFFESVWDGALPYGAFTD